MCGKWNSKHLTDWDKVYFIVRGVIRYRLTGLHLLLLRMLIRQSGVPPDDASEQVHKENLPRKNKGKSFEMMKE